MNYVFTPEQDELRSVVRDFLDKKSPEATVRRLAEDERGYDQAVWRQMADQLGLQGLAIPEEYGGAGFSFVELSIVLEEMGRRLLCGPYFSSIVLGAGTLLLSEDDSAKKEWLPGIASGQLIATLAVAEEAGMWDEAGLTATATPLEEGWTISGTKWFVSDGHIADLILVVARTEDGLSLFAVRGGSEGVSRALLPTLDQTRKQARIEFDGAPARLIGLSGTAWPAMERVLDLAATGLAAEQVGGAQFALDMAVDYAKQRHQFDRPIGSFQAIKHKCADILVEVESARSAAYYAAACAAELTDDFPQAAAIAKSYCSEAFSFAASENIQIHGGIGFTWEHPAHLYFRRARSTELTFGDAAHWRELLVQRLGV